MPIKPDFKIEIAPYNSLNKNSLYIIGAIIFFLFLSFSFLWITIGAWPITLFMGFEYIILIYLISLYYKKRKVKEDIKINDKSITYEFYEKSKLKKKIKFSSYWAKISFWKKDNISKLLISESGKKLELGKYLNSKPKEEIYKKLNHQLKNIN